MAGVGRSLRCPCEPSEHGSPHLAIAPVIKSLGLNQEGERAVQQEVTRDAPTHKEEAPAMVTRASQLNRHRVGRLGSYGSGRAPF
jgi:hypothetical protein